MTSTDDILGRYNVSLRIGKRRGSDDTGISWGCSDRSRPYSIS